MTPRVQPSRGNVLERVATANTVDEHVIAVAAVVAEEVKREPTGGGPAQLTGEPVGDVIRVVRKQRKVDFARDRGAERVRLRKAVRGVRAAEHPAKIVLPRVVNLQPPRSRLRPEHVPAVVVAETGSR